MSQIIVLESCSVYRARARARAHTKLSLASTFSSQLKAKRYNASFSVSLLDDSFSPPRPSEDRKNVSLHFSTVGSFFFFFPPLRLSSAKLWPVQNDKNPAAANQNYEEQRDVDRDGCRLQLRRQVKGQRIDRHPAGIKLRDEVPGCCSYRCSCPPSPSPQHPPELFAHSLFRHSSLSPLFIHSFIPNQPQWQK